MTQHLWIWPIVGAVVLGLVGLWVRQQVEEAMQAELATQLQTVLNANIAALQLWFSEQETDVRSFAADSGIHDAIQRLVSLERQPNGMQQALMNSPAANALDQHLMPLLQGQGYLDYVVVGTDRRILASPHRRLVGRLAPPAYELFLADALQGRLAVSRPFAREVPLSERTNGPTMFVAAPVLATNGAVLAVLGLRMQPEKEFTRIFSVARTGRTGEAYAFDRSGLMLTASRFEPELKQLKLIPNEPEASTILNLRLIDPGAALPGRGRSLHQPGPSNRPPGRPPDGSRGRPRLTRMAADATQGRAGVDVQGYRNYRGERVIGAWAWLGEYQMGVTSEVAMDEAYRPLYVLRRTFLVLFTLLVLCGIALFVFTVFIKRLQMTARKSALTARRLGQYTLVQEIGRGANGIVYRARHTLLRRPVAVKLLSPELTNEATAAGFEHEVQMTSQLTHPNTVAVYDYGRTPDGVFYYAMEFLSGINLDRLVREFGPQPEGRVIHILRQVCGSLAEAHGIGLIHRDVKPANIILTRRGGLCDVAKVLDFGLVKAAHHGTAAIPTASAIVGTPRYMAPEAIEAPETVDARGDVYSAGVVCYWLLTGKGLFDTDNVEELLSHQVRSAPTPPSERIGRTISVDLERVILQCLEKRRERRPPGAKALDDLLAHCASAGTWTAADSEQWWQAHDRAVEAAPAAETRERTLVIAPRT